MDFYTWSFIALVIACALLKYRQNQHDEKDVAEKAAGDEVPEIAGRVEAENFKKTFMVVYLLVMGADWLQVQLVHARTDLTLLTLLSGPLRVRSLQR